MATTIQVTVNGKAYSHDVDPRTLLVQYLRDVLGLTGTHVGCDTSNCGACTILVDGQAVKSCTLLAVQADGGEILSVEGLAKDGELHALQKAFSEHHGLQCGYCTPGMMMSAHALLAANPDPSARDIRKAIQGNLCRCTGYQNIFKAIEAAATELRGDG